MNKWRQNVVSGLSVVGVLALVTSAGAVNVQQHNPPGSWEVSGSGGSGAVGDIVQINFSVTHILDRCVDTEVYIETTDESRRKISFVGEAVPTNTESLVPERVTWSPTEFDNDVPVNYQVNAMIDRGNAGDIIDDFYILAQCPGKSIYRMTMDDIVVKVVEEVAAAEEKVEVARPTETPRPTPPSTETTVGDLPEAEDTVAASKVSEESLFEEQSADADLEDIQESEDTDIAEVIEDVAPFIEEEQVSVNPVRAGIASLAKAWLYVNGGIVLLVFGLLF